MINRKKLTTALGLIFCLTAVMVTAVGCGGGIPIASEVRESEGYTDSQVMIFITTEKNRYQNVYGSQIWNIEMDDSGETFQTYRLEEVQNFLQKLKTINQLADDYGIALTSQEKERLKELSAVYYDSLTEEDLAYMGTTKDDAYEMYEQYYRANKVVNELTKDVNLEISDSEAKMITVQEICLEDDQAAEDIWQQVTAEGADFASLARRYSNHSKIEIQVGRNERSATYEEVVFALQAGEISPVIQDGDTCYIVKCINDYDEEATLERKNRLSRQRKNQAFRQIYDVYAAEHSVKIQGEIWDRISLAEADGSTTTNFFEIYQEYMSN